MILPNVSPRYLPREEEERNRVLQKADRENFKRGKDVRLERGERLILRSPDGTAWVIGVDNAGAIAITAA